MKILVPFFPCIILVSCLHQSRPAAILTRDSLVKPYLEALAHAREYDTTETGNRVLKAYLSNDTAYLKDLADKLTRKKKTDEANAALDCRARVPGLADLHVDEAYRFMYDLGLSLYSFTITIYRQGDGITLHFIKYYMRFTDSFVCRVVKEYTKPLTRPQWDELTGSLKAADLWGLKFDNGVHGVDGSSLTVSGYMAPDSTKYNRQEARYTNVYRWSFSNTELGNTWRLVEKLSSDKIHKDIWEQ